MAEVAPLPARMATMTRRKPAKPAERRARLSAADIALIERLVASGALVAVPQLGSAKPRRVITAAIDPAGDRILLYLSAKPLELEKRRGAG
jgi:hypothetical protein